MKKIITLACITLAILILIIVVMSLTVFNSNKNYKDWDDYKESYKDNNVIVKNNNNSYSGNFTVKNKILYDEDNNEIIKDVLKVYSIDFDKDSYIFITDNSGKTFYLNNINKSTQDKFELTELGDYKNIVNIELKDNKIIAYDINKNELVMSEEMNTYTGYSK